MSRGLGTLSLVLALVISLSAAQAGSEPTKARPDADVVFTKLDANHDGKLTQDEFLQIAERFTDRTKARQRLTAVYQQIDPQHQGVSRDQFRTFLEAHRKKKDAGSGQK